MASNGEGSVKDLKSQSERKKDKDPNRGTTDELEIMRLVIFASPLLKQRVLDKIRAEKARIEGSQTKSLKPLND